MPGPMRRAAAEIGALLLASLTATCCATPAADVSCNHTRDLAFVAHVDDDLLFMNPDIADTIAEPGCLMVVYLTAGDRGEGTPYALGREQGARAAYASIAGVPDHWTEDTGRFGARRAARFTLNGNPRITLLAMRIKDPWLGKGWGSLTPLSRAESVPGQTAQTLGPYPETYTRDGLVEAIADIIRAYRPTTIRYMDASVAIAYTALCWRCRGHDHPDHIASARLVRDAMDLARGNYAQISYLNYPSQERAANLTPDEAASKTRAFLAYAQADHHYCKDPAACPGPAGPEAAWVDRIYYVSSKNTPPKLLAGPRGSDYALLTVNEHVGVAGIWDNADRRWTPLGGRTVDPATAFELQGEYDVLLRDANGRLWLDTQASVGTQPSWRALRGARLTHPPTITHEGLPAAIAMGNDGRFHCIAKAGTGLGWSDWMRLPPLEQARSFAAITHDRLGRLTVFANDAHNEVWRSTLRPPDVPGRAASWGAWEHLPGMLADGGLAAMLNPLGRIELYMRDPLTGHMLRTIQQSTDLRTGRPGAWSPPEDMGFAYVGQAAIGANEHGDVAVAALERHKGLIWLLEKGQARKLPAAATSTPSLQTLGGTLYVAARSDAPDQEYWVMARRLGIWSPPQRIQAAGFDSPHHQNDLRRASARP